MKRFMLVLLLLGVCGSVRGDDRIREMAKLCHAIREGDYKGFAWHVQTSPVDECTTKQNPTTGERAVATGLGFLMPMFWYVAAHEEPETPLAMAVWYKRIGMVRELLDRDADVNHQDPSGYTALHWASSSIFGEDTYLEIARLLLQRGARGSLNLKDYSGKRPLHWAVEHGHTEIARLLLDHGAGVNLQDNAGKTPLHYAYQFESNEGLKELLLRAGASQHIRDGEGRLPYEVKRLGDRR